MQLSGWAPGGRRFNSHPRHANAACPRRRARGDRISWRAVRLVGINHVALEVGDVEEALAWYGRSSSSSCVAALARRWRSFDIGDQFIAIAAGRSQPPNQGRHFGLAVDDKQSEQLCKQRGQRAGGSVDFLDPRGNHVQVVDYREIQFSREDPRREAGAPQQGSRRRLTGAADRFHGRRRSVTDLAPVARHCWHKRMWRRLPPVARRLQFVTSRSEGDESENSRSPPASQKRRENQSTVPATPQFREWARLSGERSRASRAPP